MKLPKWASSIIEDIRKALDRETDYNPWEKDDEPELPYPVVSDDDLDEAIKEMRDELVEEKPPSMLITTLIQVFLIIWSGAHLVLAYTIVGSPISGGAFLYIIMTLSISVHYFVLIRKVRVPKKPTVITLHTGPPGQGMTYQSIRVEEKKPNE